MQLGNPSNATVDSNNHSHYLIQRTVESLDYSDSFGEANWASWDLTISDTGTSGRSSSFTTDSTLPSNFYHVSTSDYTNSGYNRGHLCPSADRTDNDTDNAIVFYMSNIAPQTADNNQGPWASFESYCRSLASSGNELLIMCGGSGFSSTIASGKVAVPSYTWKVAVVVPAGIGSAVSRIDSSTRVITIKVPNISGIRSNPWTQYVVSSSVVEADTGLNFFSSLPSTVAAVLRAKVDGAPAPAITGFTPLSGTTNSTVVISGSNLTGASTVSFGGTNAAFSVDSDTQITATVPVGAASGQISVIAPGGLATSSASFTVTVPASDILYISQVYGGGGNSGSLYKSDFVELYNAGATTIDLSNYAVQYTSATGSVWQETLLSGLVLPGHYYLIQESGGASGTQNLPTPQVSGTINLSSSSGKIALTKSQTLLTGSNPLANSSIVDFIGYGTADTYLGTAAAPALSNTTSAIRANYGNTNSSSNSADFSTGVVTPRDGSGYDAWRSRNFSASELSLASVSGDNASPSGDGVTNLSKYAFNLDPHKADGVTAASYTAQSSGATRTLTLTHRKNRFAKDVSFVYELSPDLVAWATGNTSAPAVTSFDAQTDTVSVAATSSAGTLYMRVKVSHQ